MDKFPGPKNIRASAYNSTIGSAAKSLDGPEASQGPEERLIQKKGRLKYLVAGGVSLITFIVYLASLRNGFVIWDDNVYISENPHIRSLDLAFFKWAFFDFYTANWHPLTWISHALDYAVWGLNPLGHHLMNNVLHAINTFLVVLLVSRLLANWQADKLTSSQDSRFTLTAAAVTGLLFGLHPLHVESVAWLAERKDLLCALFYLLSVIKYMSYGTYKTHTAYFLSLGFFILALLSKPMAVTLPVVLLVLDWYPLARIHSFKSFWTACLEKLPFVVLCIISSILTILAQKAGGALSAVAMIVNPLPERAALAAKSLVSYLWKMVLPLDLIPLYPYPKHIAPLSLEYLAPAALVAGTTILCVVLARKQKLWLAVWTYYIITLLPVIGLVPVGVQSMADRYAYLPSLGPFLVMGLLVSWISGKVSAAKEKGPLIRVVSAAAAVLIVVSMTYLTFKQIGIWRSRIDMWSHVIEIEPDKVPLAYGSRGDAFYEMGQLNRALEDYNRALALDPFYTGTYYERGRLFAEMRQFDRAIADYDKAIMLDEIGARSDVGREFYFLNRGIAYIEIGQPDRAASDLTKACELGSDRGCKILQSLRSTGLNNR